MKIVKSFLTPGGNEVHVVVEFEATVMPPISYRPTHRQIISETASNRINLTLSSIIEEYLDVLFEKVSMTDPEQMELGI